jgi:ABC-2 type transport system permease protein
MTGLIPLLKKEIKEQLRTRKLLITGCIFIFFGITTPLMLKYLPEILKIAGSGGLEINVPEPTAIQSLTEYTGTIGQIGVLIAVLMAMGGIANEIRHGTAILTLSKPVSRGAFVIAKLIAHSSTFIISLIAASLICYFYTVLLIGSSDVKGFVLQNVLLIIFLIFCLAVTLLFSSWFSSPLAAGGLAIAVIISQAASSAIPRIGDYFPGKLLAWGNMIVAGTPGSYWWALGITIFLIVISLFWAQVILNKKDL